MGDHTLTYERPGDGARRSAPRLLCVLEASSPQAASSCHALGRIDDVVIGRGATRAVERAVDDGVRRLSLTLPDRWMSTRHARVFRAHQQWIIEDLGSKNGCVVNGQSKKQAALADGDIVELGHTFLMFRAGPADPAADDVSAGALSPAAPELATFVPELAAELDAVARVARSAVEVLITGETGTGKEIVARAVHRLSGRGGPFVAVNCGAIAPTLLEAELFGHRRGAFSGALEDRPGLIRGSDRGTLFLDEAGDLPAAAQAALLRALQEREVLPVGDTRPVKVDLHVVCATHRDLAAMAEAGQFRRDLLARLRGLVVSLPPLRQRREDLGLLLSAIVRRVAPRPDRVTLSGPAAAAVFAHDWPLNIRELEKCIAAAVALAGDGPILPQHLPAAVRNSLSARPSRSLTPDEENRRRELTDLLVAHRGNVSAVARALATTRAQVHRLAKRFGLRLGDYR